MCVSHTHQGSSLFLKSKFCVNYNLQVEVKEKFKIDRVGEKILQFIQYFVPSAQRNKGFAKGRNDGFSNLLLFSLPVSASENFSPLLKQIETQKEQLNILRYGISLSSLDEVFMMLCDLEIESQAAEEAEEDGESLDNVLQRMQTSVLTLGAVPEPIQRQVTAKLKK